MREIRFAEVARMSNGRTRTVVPEYPNPTQVLFPEYHRKGREREGREDGGGRKRREERRKPELIILISSASV